MIIMRELRDKIKIFGMQGDTEVNALFDTESPYGYVSKEIADKIGLLVFPEEHETTLPDKTVIKMKPALGIIEVKGCRKPVWT